jgi:hypothetical protein
MGTNFGSAIQLTFHVALTVCHISAAAFRIRLLNRSEFVFLNDSVQGGLLLFPMHGVLRGANDSLNDKQRASHADRASGVPDPPPSRRMTTPLLFLFPRQVR